MSASTILNELERGPAFVFSSLRGGVPGYALTNVKDGVLDLLRLGVAKDMQGYGLGKLLLRRVLRVPHQVCVLTVRKNNDRAWMLYKSVGFELHGEEGDSMVLVRTATPPTRGRRSCT